MHVWIKQPGMMHGRGESFYPTTPATVLHFERVLGIRSDAKSEPWIGATVKPPITRHIAMRVISHLQAAISQPRRQPTASPARRRRLWAINLTCRRCRHRRRRVAEW